MAKKIVPLDPIPTELIKPKSEFNKILEEQIAKGEDILNGIIAYQDLINSRQVFSYWFDYNSEYLKHAFNKELNEYKDSFDRAGTSVYGFLGGDDTPAEEFTKFRNKVSSKIENLKRLRAKTELLKTSIPNVEEPKKMAFDKSQVFIVHGHDEEAKVKTARFIEKIGFRAVILHEQASSGKTVIEKIEEYSNVGFGIVLYTPCDTGSKKMENPVYKNRARQNVVFEHGYLIGKIGRKNVCALVKGDIETPNDISGVIYIKMDDEDAWHVKLAKELRNSGYQLDMNKVF